MEPGKQFSLPFTVATNSSGGSFKISVSNNRNFKTLFNAFIALESGGSANDTVTLTAAENTFTVTIQAETPNGIESNYAVLRIAVIAPVNNLHYFKCSRILSTEL